MRVTFIRPVDGFTLGKPYIVPDSHGRHYINGKMAVSAETSEEKEDVPAVINRPSSVVVADPVAPIIRRTDKAAPENAKTEADVTEPSAKEGDVKAGVPDNIPERAAEHVEIVEGKDGLKSPKRSVDNAKTEKTKASGTVSPSTAKTTAKARTQVSKGKKS